MDRKAEHRFYLYGTFSEGIDTPDGGEFSFVVDSYRELRVPSFLIWPYRDTDGQALLCKIRRITRPADLGMKVYVTDAISVRMYSHGLENSVYSSLQAVDGMTAQEFIAEVLHGQTFYTVPDDKFSLLKNEILKSNPGTVDESYFVFNNRICSDEVTVEAIDAFRTAFRIFGVPTQIMPELREHQILDFDIATIFADAKKSGVTPDGKHFFEHAGRRLYLHKVDRTKIERCLGVDLIYNYLDERRLVFVQYKCQRTGGKYYPRSDASHDMEIQRMGQIPGLSNCWNLHDASEGRRLCRCPVFIKLCRREISHAHAVPVGVYFPHCLWQWMVGQEPGITVRTEPHLNSQHFQDLVRNGLIGSTPQQSSAIEEHLIYETDDDRLKLIFDEITFEAADSAFPDSAFGP